MELYQKIVVARKKKGLTQDELASLTNITVRTIQRIESGKTTPRSYTLKTIAGALDINFEELIIINNNESINNSISSPAVYKDENGKHFLEVLCLSCFSYLVIPFIHFLVPSQLLKRSNEQNPIVIAFAKRLIRLQLYWKVSLWLLMLLTLAYNIISVQYFQRSYLVNYLWPFFMMYFLNAIIIAAHLLLIKKIDLTPQHQF